VPPTVALVVGLTSDMTASCKESSVRTVVAPRRDGKPGGPRTSGTAVSVGVWLLRESYPV